VTGQLADAEADEPRQPVRAWLLDWIDNDATPHQQTDSVRGVLWHDADAWRGDLSPTFFSCTTPICALI